jgi:hypothetical protein
MSLLDKMKETAQKGVSKTKEAVSAGQDMLETRKIENRIEELKEELGGLVYGQRTGSPAENADAEIDRVIGEIQAAEAELANLDEADTSEAAAGDASPSDSAPGAAADA